MAEFNPEDYLVEKEAEEFNPDEYLASKNIPLTGNISKVKSIMTPGEEYDPSLLEQATPEPQQKQPISLIDTMLASAAGASIPIPRSGPPSLAESTLRGGMQGATLGSGEEIAGALFGGKGSLKGGLKSIGGGITGKDVMSDEDVQAYIKARDAERKLNEEAQQEHPIGYMGGQIVGSVLPIAAIPGAAGAGTLETLATQGARIGTAQTLGSSEAELAKGEREKLLKETAKGAASGAALNVMFPQIFKSMKKSSTVTPPPVEGVPTPINWEGAKSIAHTGALGAGTGAVVGGLGSKGGFENEYDRDLLKSDILSGAGVGMGAALTAKGIVGAGRILVGFPKVQKIIEAFKEKGNIRSPEWEKKVLTDSNEFAKIETQKLVDAKTKAGKSLNQAQAEADEEVSKIIENNLKIEEANAKALADTEMAARRQKALDIVEKRTLRNNAKIQRDKADNEIAILKDIKKKYLEDQSLKLKGKNLEQRIQTQKDLVSATEQGEAVLSTVENDLKNEYNKFDDILDEYKIETGKEIKINPKELLSELEKNLKLSGGMTETQAKKIVALFSKDAGYDKTLNYREFKGLKKALGDRIGTDPIGASYAKTLEKAPKIVEDAFSAADLEHEYQYLKTIDERNTIANNIRDYLIKAQKERSGRLLDIPQDVGELAPTEVIPEVVKTQDPSMLSFIKSLPSTEAPDIMSRQNIIPMIKTLSPEKGSEFLGKAESAAARASAAKSYKVPPVTTEAIQKSVETEPGYASLLEKSKQPIPTIETEPLDIYRAKQPQPTLLEKAEVPNAKQIYEQKLKTATDESELKKAQDVLDSIKSMELTGGSFPEVQPYSKKLAVPFSDKMIDMLVASVETKFSPADSKNFEVYMTEYTKLMGKDAAEAFKTKATDLVKKLLMGKTVTQVKQSTQGDISVAGRTELLGTLGSIVEIGANAAGRATRRAGEIGSILKDTTGLKGLSNSARKAGFEKLANIIDNMSTKDLTSRSAQLYVIQSNPELKKQYDAALKQTQGLEEPKE